MALNIIPKDTTPEKWFMNSVVDVFPRDFVSSLFDTIRSSDAAPVALMQNADGGVELIVINSQSFAEQLATDCRAKVCGSVKIATLIGSGNVDPIVLFRYLNG